MSRPPGPNQRFPLQGELAPWPLSQAQRHLWLSQLGGEAGTKLSVLPGPGRPPWQRPAGLACPGAVDGNPAHEHASDPGHTQTPCSRLPSPPTKTTRPTPLPGVSRGYCLFPGARHEPWVPASGHRQERLWPPPAPHRAAALWKSWAGWQLGKGSIYGKCSSTARAHTTGAW